VKRRKAPHKQRFLPIAATQAAEYCVRMTIPEGWRIWELHRVDLLSRRTHRACPACGEDHPESYFTSQCGYDYVECGDCRMVYCPDAVTFETWGEVYEQNADYKAYMQNYTINPLSRKTEVDSSYITRFSEYFERIKRAADLRSLEDLRYLDIGTFDGDALVVAHERFGMEAFGIEARSQIVDLAVRYRGLRVAAEVSDTMDPQIFGGAFDIVTAFESLEHTFKPVETLRRMCAALKPDGFAMVTVPNVDNFEIRQLREYSPHVSGGLIGTGHINLFGVQTLKTAMEAAGFSIIETFTQYSSSIQNVAAKLLGQFGAIQCYETILKDVETPLKLDDGARDLLGRLSIAFSEWEPKELKGPILGIIVRRA
jgi:2-polyprenyl-3-methyl-5-hydroxy-6-metoxy-1,4-benzoquinol methylase